MCYKVKFLSSIALMVGLFGFSAVAQEPDLLGNAVSNNSQDVVEGTQDLISFDDTLPLSLSIEEPVLKEEVVVLEAENQTKGPAANIEVPIANVDNQVANTILPAEKVMDETSVLLDEYNQVVDDEIFSKMTDLERESALLTLQLRKEKIQNDIEAVKKQRTAAEDQEKEKKEAVAEKKRLAAQEEQRKMLEEQQKLRDKDIALEKLRQEKLLKNYKDKSLADRQVLIEKNKVIYGKIADSKKERTQVIGNVKNKLSQLSKSIEAANTSAVDIKKANDSKIADLQTQISVLKSKLEAEERKNQTNPFEEKAKQQSSESTPAKAAVSEKPKESLEDVYAVMEIRGKGDKLIAKLLNKDGQSFLAQIGTKLQTGHIVDEISETYLRADRTGEKEYIYFAAGGVLEQEPVNKIEKKADVAEAAPVSAPQKSMNVSRGLPGISSDMVR